MVYGNNADESRRLVDYISRVVDALSSQDGVALAELLAVSGGSWGHSVASALDITKVGTVHLCRSVSQSKEIVPVFKFEEFPTNDQADHKLVYALSYCKPCKTSNIRLDVSWQFSSTETLSRATFHIK